MLGEKIPCEDGALGRMRSRIGRTPGQGGGPRAGHQRAGVLSVARPRARQGHVLQPVARKEGVVLSSHTPHATPLRASTQLHGSTMHGTMPHLHQETPPGGTALCWRNSLHAEGRSACHFNATHHIDPRERNVDALNPASAFLPWKDMVDRRPIGSPTPSFPMPSSSRHWQRLGPFFRSR